MQKGYCTNFKDKVTEREGCGGGLGFLLTCEELGRRFDHSFLACAFFFFLKWRLAHAR